MTYVKQSKVKRVSSINAYMKVVFRYGGRLGNAIFRYLACATLAVKNNLSYILEEDWVIENGGLIIKIN